MAATVLVTGATKGIGRAVADSLAGRGCHVVGLARHAAAGFPGTLLACDLSRIPETQAALREIAARFEVDGIVNAAPGPGRWNWPTSALP